MNVRRVCEGILMRGLWGTESLYGRRLAAVWSRFSVQAPAELGAGAMMERCSETRIPPRGQSGRSIFPGEHQNRACHHSHTCQVRRRVTAESPTAHALIEDCLALSPEPQLHSPTFSRLSDDVKQSTIDRRTAKFFPSCVISTDILVTRWLACGQREHESTWTRQS